MASTQFADIANIPRPTISQILNGRNRKISNEVIEKIHIGFPDLNIMWLLFGDGDMVRQSSFKTSEATPHPNMFNSPTHTSGSMPFIGQPMSNPKVNTPMQTSSIDDLVNETIRQRRINDEQSAAAKASAISSAAKPNEKSIRYIMVFFNDNTFETLTPVL